MRTRDSVGLVCVCVLAFGSSRSFAQDAEDVQKLSAETQLFEAKKKRDDAEAAALAAEAALAKARATAGRAAQDIEAANITSDIALAKARVSSDAATLAAYKETFGTVPTVGKDGNVQISDSTGGQLLRTKSGSLQITAQLAKKLCEQLQAAGVQKAFIAPADLETKIQGSRLLLNEFNYLSAKTAADQDWLAGEIQQQVAGAAVLSGLSLARYGIDGVVQLLRAARSDVTVGLTDAKRETWLNYFASGYCPAQLPRAQVEAVVRAQPFDDTLEQLNKMIEFADNVDRLKTDATEELTASKQALAEELKKPSPNSGNVKSLESQVKKKAGRVKELATRNPLVARIRAMAQVVSSKPQEFIDALTWNRFTKAPLSEEPRLVVVLTTQDGQIVKDGYWTGKRVHGLSSGELIYRVQNPDGTLKTTGFITATEALGKIDFDASVPADGTVISAISAKK